MTPQAAQSLLSSLFAPGSAAHFFEQVSGRVSHHRAPATSAFRRGLLGPDPADAILNAHARLAGQVKLVTPADDNKTAPKAAFADRTSFARAIGRAHAQRSSVMIHNGCALGGEVALVKRALEQAVGGPVHVTVFWSPAGTMTKAHRDGLDILTVQVAGAKSWLISAEALDFPNHWSEISPGAGGLKACNVTCAEAEPHAKVTVREGDLLYTPRGQWHEVHTLDRDSISLAFGFRQATSRDVLNSLIDYLSDRERALRRGVGRDEALAGSNGGSAVAAGPFVQALSRAASFYRRGDNFREAMAWRRASFIGALPALGANGAAAAASLMDEVRLAPLAICFVSTDQESVILSYPGDHLTAPIAFEPAFRFVAETDRFRVRDLPGRITDKSRLKIVNKLIACGVLELAC